MDPSLPPGLKNHGNTCFMNAIIQCLSNTDFIAEYFVAGHYLVDFKKHNKLHSRNGGTRGQLTDQLAILLKSLWTNQYNQDISCKFKNIVSKFGSQYQGSEQHDAQEFLLWLLDKVHEDLNVAVKKKNKKVKNYYIITRSDEEIAAESLANHVRMNRSFIQDLIQGQLRSSLLCKSCGKESNTFDPYLCLSLPVPTRQLHTIIVNIAYLKSDRREEKKSDPREEKKRDPREEKKRDPREEQKSDPREVKMAVSIESQATLRELRDKISRLIKIPEKQLVLLMLDNENGLRELVNDGQIVQEFLDDLQEICAVQTPPLSGVERKSPVQECADSGSGQALNLVLVNRIGSSGQGALFGPLFSCQVSREVSFKQLQTQILETFEPILKGSLDPNIVKESVLFRLRVIGGISGKNYLPEDVDHPLYMPTVDKAISHTEDKGYRGSLHLMLVVEWEKSLRDSLLLSDGEIPEPRVDPSVEYMKERSSESNQVKLKDCLELYFKEEKLGAENAWMCPGCKRRQQSVKKLSLWSIPDVFIIHLKRFRLSSTAQRSKTTTFVDFPLSGLNMNPYIVQRTRKNPSVKNGFTNDTNRFTNDTNRFTNDTNRFTNGFTNDTNGFTSHDHFPSNCQHRSSSLSSQTLPSLWSHPWQRPSLRLRKMSPRGEEDSFYDLFGVCNHLGNMQGGHYTAFCKSPVDGRWFSYDDMKVTEISEKDVQTSDAYILFYQRSTLSTPSSASSSSSGYSSSISHLSNDVHWSLRLSNDQLRSDPYDIDLKESGGTLRRSRGVLRNSDTLNRQNVRACSTLPSSTKAARKLYQLFFKSPHVERVETSIRRRSPSPTGSRRSSSHKPESNAIFASQMRVILPEQKPLVETKSNKSPSTSPIKSPSTDQVKSPSTSPVKSPSTSPVKSPSTSQVKSPSCVSLDRSPSSQGLTDSSTCLIPKKVYTVTSV